MLLGMYILICTVCSWASKKVLSLNWSLFSAFYKTTSEFHIEELHLVSVRTLRCHIQHTIYSQIPRSDTRPHIKRAVNLVNRNGHFLIFLGDCVGMYGLTCSLESPQRYIQCYILCQAIRKLLCSRSSMPQLHCKLVDKEEFEFEGIKQS